MCIRDSVNQIRYNIRVISNSFGNTGDVGTPFDPEDPTNVATKALADRGVVVVFSAGNSGAGERTITGNFKKAPWVITVAAGDNNGSLTDFSSRGLRGNGGTVAVDGTTYTWEDAPSVTAPGNLIVSTRASTGADGALSATDDVNLPTAYLPFYTILSGTSMACPHVSGIVALMLEANPQLDVYEAKRILKATATNMPGFERWEVGAGYANAYNAVVMSLRRRTDFGATLTATNTFVANAVLSSGGSTLFSVDFAPVGPRDVFEFQVAADIAIVTARATVPENTVALVLTDPLGNRYGSSISLPLLGSTVAASGPGVPGTWKLTVSGIGSVSGVALDPARVTNGYALPATIEGRIDFTKNGGYTGIDDLSGHPAQGAVQYAIFNRLMDGLKNKKFMPDAALTRGQMAQYLVWGGAVRQSLPLAGGFTFGDASGALAPYAEAAGTRAGALKDRFHRFGPVMRASGSFNTDGGVTRTDLAYSLVQALGLETQAKALNSAFANGSKTMAVRYDTQLVPLADAASIPADLKGYVQLALDLSLLDARFGLTQGPFDTTPTISARFNGGDSVTRARYAVAAMAFHERYLEGDLSAALGNGGSESTVPALSQSTTIGAGLNGVLALDNAYPNPARDAATVRFRLPEAQRIRLAAYDAVGREVALLAEGEMPAGNHTAQLDGGSLASGIYVLRLQSGSGVLTRTVTFVR